MSRPQSKRVKQQLFLNCGRIDMYDMEAYSKKTLQLHHDPPFKYTHHTVYDESYLLSPNNHQELHYYELKDPEEYERRMVIIRKNKKILEKKRQG
jgi:hypothetical protein